MAYPGQLTISLSATGDAVKLKQALWRKIDHSINIDGVFGPQLDLERHPESIWPRLGVRLSLIAMHRHAL